VPTEGKVLRGLSVMVLLRAKVLLSLSEMMPLTAKGVEYSV
jgi:hypothetical protein